MKTGGHVLIPYKVEENDNNIKVFVYDCNSIALGEDANCQYIVFKKNSSGKVKEWKYELWPGLEWNSSQLMSSITYIEDFDVVSTILERGIIDSTNNSLFVSDASKYQIVQENGNIIQVDNGYVSGDEDGDLIQISNNNLLINDNSVSRQQEPDMFYINENSDLKIINDSKESVEISMFGEDEGIGIKSDGKSIFNVESSESSMGAEICPSEDGENYILFEGEEKTLKIESNSQSKMSASMNLKTNNVELPKEDDVTISIIKDESVVEERFVNADSKNLEFDWSGDEVIIKEDSNGDGSYDRIIVDEKQNEESTTAYNSSDGKNTTSQKEKTTQQQTSNNKILKDIQNSKKTIKTRKLLIRGKKKIRVGKKMYLKAIFKPGNVTNKKVRWFVSSKKYAGISKKGVFKPKKAGKGKKVTIICKALDGSKKVAKIKIKINK